VGNGGFAVAYAKIHGRAPEITARTKVVGTLRFAHPTISEIRPLRKNLALKPDFDYPICFFAAQRRG
jgi:hypothetical protein